MTKRLKQTNCYPSIVAWLKSYLDIFDSSGKAYCDMIMIVGYRQFEQPSVTDFDWPAISNETISIHAIFLLQRITAYAGAAEEEDAFISADGAGDVF